MSDTRTDALHLLARRELSVAECRDRLLDRGHPPDAVDVVLDGLVEDGSLDDARTARAYARTAVNVRGRGRLRVLRELVAKGIDRNVASEAVGEVFSELDERSLVARAIQKKLHGGNPSDRTEFARLYQFLMRQGFTPGSVSAALEKLRRPGGSDD